MGFCGAKTYRLKIRREADFQKAKAAPAGAAFARARDRSGTKTRKGFC
jgi:hypothetical protein